MSFRFTSLALSSLLLTALATAHVLAADLPLEVGLCKCVKQYDPNERIAISIDPRLLPADSGNLAVRVLPGDFEELRMFYLGRTEGGCRRYNSILLPGGVDPNGVIEFSVSESWLKRDGDHFVPTRYTIAVERRGLPAGEVKIDDGALEEYFRRSLIMELKAPSVQTLPVRVITYLWELVAPATAHADTLPTTMKAPKRAASKQKAPKPVPKHPPEADCILTRKG